MSEAPATLYRLRAWHGLAVRRLLGVVRPRRLRSRDRWHESRRLIVGGSAILSLMVTVAFLVVAADGLLHAPPTATVTTWAIWLGVLWLFAGPVLMTDGELNYRRAVTAICDAGQFDGWDVAKVRRTADRIDRAAPWVIALLAVLVTALTALNYDVVAARMGLAPSLGSSSGAVTLLVAVSLGISVGSGFWGVLATYVLVRGAVGAEGEADVAYHPFDGRQVHGLEELTRMSFRSAMYFSTGSLLVPALVQASADMSALAAVISWTVIAALLAGGTVVYVAPNVMIARLARRQWADSVDRLAPALADAVEQHTGVAFSSDGPRQPRRVATPDLQVLLEVHRELRALSAHPVNQTAVVQGLSTFILPVAVVAIEQLVS